MKKSMRKTAFALCVALSVFMCKPAFAFAAVCGPSPDKVHHFDAHQRESGEFGQTGGYHSYLYGYSAQGQPLYKNDCRLTKSFPIFRTIDFCKKAPLLSHLQIPAYTLTELFCKNYTTLQIKSGIAPSVACQIVLKSIVYIVLFCYNWTIYFTQFS